VVARDTKRMFADELESMMRRTPLSKVRVAELCERCGVERRVFYYHFRDKYDLVAWMFEQDRLAAGETCAPYTEEFYAEAHRMLWARRDFYRRAFDEDAQNSIYRYLLQFSIEANEAALKDHLHVSKLSRDLVFDARHFAHGNVGCVVDWLRGHIEASPAQLASCIFACMPAELREAYDAAAEK
ncbi:MAG: TetR/AcrR family transcriptional regulator C-terminal domain-containing protein, partial [Eggerthellaceae bacterium]|nr:TetR/AcrR family transcriptional regulator C-terminal domain-containing protein [Eggerthellaceae bacterium]